MEKAHCNMSRQNKIYIKKKILVHLSVSGILLDRFRLEVGELDVRYFHSYVLGSILFFG